MRILAAVGAAAICAVGGTIVAIQAGGAIIQAINEAYSRYGSGHGPRY